VGWDDQFETRVELKVDRNVTEFWKSSPVVIRPFFDLEAQ
jgi:hypothetical protein